MKKFFNCLIHHLLLQRRPEPVMFIMPVLLVLIAPVMRSEKAGSLIAGVPESGKKVPGLDSVRVPDDEEDPYIILVTEAEKAVSDSNYSAAAQRLLEAIRLRPDDKANYMLLANVGELYTRLQQDSLACEAYDRAVEMAEDIDADASWILGNRARCLLRLGEDARAFDDFSGILSTDSLNGEARYFHGMIALFAGRKETAEKDFDVLERHYPQSAATAKAMGTLYAMTGRDAEAIPYLEKIIKDSPAPEYYASLAGCQLALGRLSEASSTIGEGLRSYPADPELYYYRVWLNRDLYRMDDAEADAKSAIILGANPKKVEALFQKEK